MDWVAWLPVGVILITLILSAIVIGVVSLRDFEIEDLLEEDDL